MKLYADRPGRLLGQLVADLAVVAFCAACVWFALAVHQQVVDLAEAPRSAGEAAGDLGDNLRAAAEQVSGIPLVPDGVAAPFDGSAGAADAMAEAGTATVAAIEDVAVYLALAVAVLPILLVLGSYLPGRISWVRVATSGQRLLDSGDNLDLFALRALTRQPLHVLARVTDDPAGGWRRGEPDAVRALALLELRDCGLDPARRLPAARGAGS